MEKNLTTEQVLKTVICFSLPFLLSNLLQTLYGMADLFIIGQFNGIHCTTAVSIGSQIMHMLTVILVGFAMGSTVLISQSVGAKRKEEVSKTIGNTAILFMTLSFTLMIILLLNTNKIVNLISTPQEAVSETIRYLQICFMGIPAITAYNILSAIFRGLGDSKSPMYFIAVACVINISLDYVLIGGLKMGASGAALGTVLSQSVSVILSLVLILKGKLGIQLCKNDFQFSKKTVSNLLKIGTPIALQDGFIQISFILITLFANRRGLNDAAAVGIVEKIISILFLVPSAMLQTVSALAAQNIGAKKPDRARKVLDYSLILSVIWGIMACLIMMFHSKSILALFVQNSPQTILLGSQYMQGYVWDCIFAGIHFCFSGFFCAYGLSGLSFFHNLISILLIRLPFSYIASTVFMDTLFPMGLASSCGSAVSVLICIVAFLWMNKKQSGGFYEKI